MIDLMLMFQNKQLTNKSFTIYDYNILLNIIFFVIQHKIIYLCVYRF